MAIRVSATETNPTHHLSLTDGTDTLGLILSDGGGKVNALGLKQSGYPRSVTRISQGVSGYSDFELPYSPTVQSDFSGGRGLEDFEKDSTRFYDAYRADTTRGDGLCGPKATRTTSRTVNSLATNAYLFGLSQSGIAERYACKFTTTEAMNVERVRLRLGYIGVDGDVASVEIWSDSGGYPGSMLQSFFPDSVGWHNNNGDNTDIYFWIAGAPGTTYAMAAGTYHIYYYFGNFETPATHTIGINNNAPGYNIMRKVGTGSWATIHTNHCIDFTLFPSEGADVMFFEYNSLLFHVLSPGASSPPKLYMNGYVGMVQSGSTAYKIVTNLDLTGVSLAGKILKIVRGKGSEETQNWRKIISNTTGAGAAITVDIPWNSAPNTTSEFVVLGCNNWSAVTGHGMTKRVTDVMVLDDMVFFAQGETTTIVRGKMASGVWAWYFDGTDAATGNKATFLKYIYDVTGKKRVWRALARASAVSYAAKPTWAASNSATMTFLTDVICGSSDSAITGIEEYSPGGPLIPYILKEDGFGSIGGTTDTVVGVYSEHPLSAQLKNVRSENNGRAHMRYDLFLKFSLLDGLESHYDQRIDDVGPNRDEGLPIGRTGPIYHMVPYAGRFYAAVDGGPNGQSSILCCTRDNSWHEIYRGEISRRILRTHIQVIPGDSADRLWFGEGGTIYWLPLAIDPRKQADYTYFSGAQVMTAWIYSGFKDVNKYFHELTIFAENLDTTHQYIQVGYRVDNETTWTNITTNYTTSPSQTIRLSTANNVSGKRIQLCFTMVTDDELVSPRIKAYRLDGVIRLKPKKMWSVTYMVKDNQEDLTRTEQSGLTIGGVAANWTPENVLTLLDKWADSDQNADPLTMRTLRTLNDNKLVFIEPTSITPLSQVTDPGRKIVMVGSFTLLEA